MITVTDIKEALQAGGLGVFKVKNTKTNIGRAPECVMAEQLYHVTKCEDPSGNIWEVPTAWAYFAVCRAHYWHRHQLRQNGIEPCHIPTDAPLHPADEKLQPVMHPSFAQTLRDLVLGFGHENFDWPKTEDAIGGELSDAAEALAVRIAERLGFNTDSYWGVQGAELVE